MAPPNYKCNSAFHLPHLIREDSLPLQGQPSADLDSGSPGFFGAYGQHLPKAFLPAEGGGVGRRGDACRGNLSTSAVDTGGTLYLKVTDGANSRTLHAQVT